MDGDAGASWLIIGYNSGNNLEVSSTGEGGSGFGVDPAGAWFWHWSV
jgi:hypothetical protein